MIKTSIIHKETYAARFQHTLFGKTSNICSVGHCDRRYSRGFSRNIVIAISIMWQNRTLRTVFDNFTEIKYEKQQMLPEGAIKLDASMMSSDCGKRNQKFIRDPMFMSLSRLSTALYIESQTT